MNAKKTAWLRGKKKKPSARLNFHFNDDHFNDHFNH